MLSFTLILYDDSAKLLSSFKKYHFSTPHDLQIDNKSCQESSEAKLNQSPL